VSSGPPGSTTTRASETTTTQAVEDDSLAELAGALAEVMAIVEDAERAEHLGAGTLLENGAFADELELDEVPEVAFDIRAFTDEEGVVWVVVLGDITAVSQAWFEFDAVAADGFTVIREMSVIGTGEGPPWVEETPQGFSITLGEPPALPALQGIRITADVGIADGIVIRTGLNLGEDWDHMSGWVYAAFLADRGTRFHPEAKYLYEHFQVDFDRLAAESASDALEVLSRYSDRYRDALVHRGIAVDDPDEVIYLLDEFFEDYFDDD